MFQADRADKIGRDTFSRFNIRATPTVMIIGPDGSEIDWQVGYGPPPEKFQEQIEKSVKGEDTFKYYSDLYAKDPKNIEAVFNLARKYDRRYIQDKATELYKEVLALDPDGKLGTTEYGKAKVTYTQYAEYQIAAAQAMPAGGQPNSEPLRAFIKKYPEGPLVKAAYQRLSFTFRAPKASEEATKFFEEYVARYPDDPNALSSYVQYIIRTKGDLDRGIQLSEKIEELDRMPNPRHVKDMAELYILKGDKAKAEEVYGKDFADDQVAMLGYNLMDYANFWVGQKENIDSAIAMAETALKLRPDNTYIIQQAASIYCKQDMLDKALAIYGPDYIGKYMDKASTLSSYGRFWANQGQNLDSALDAAKKSVALAPDEAYNWGVLGQVYLKMKKYDEAIAAEKKAMDLAEGPQKTFFKNLLDAAEKEKAKEGK